MRILLLVLAGILAVLTVKKDKVPGYKIWALALVAAGLAVASTQWRSDELRYDASEDESLGYVLGKVVAEELPSGGQVLILDTGSQPGKSPRADARYQGVLDALGDAGFEPTRIDPTDLIDTSGDPIMKSEAIYALAEGYMNSGPFFRVLRKHPDAEAVVSFVGLPYDITQQHFARLPSMYLGQRGSLQASSQDLLRQENIRAVVEIRSEDDRGATSAEKKELPKSFNERYRLLRPAV